MMCLELLVAFLQAYIFALLTSVFIGLDAARALTHGSDMHDMLLLVQDRRRMPSRLH